MTPEPVNKHDLLQPGLRPVSVYTALDKIITALGVYYPNIAIGDGPVLAISDAAAQPWLTLGATAPVPDVGSPVPAGSAAAFFLRPGEQAVGAFVKGAHVDTEDYFIPDWNYSGIGAGPQSFTTGFSEGFH